MGIDENKPPWERARYIREAASNGKNLMNPITELVQIDNDGKLFLSGMIEDWQPILDHGIDTVIDLEGDVDHGVPTNTDQFL